MDGFVGNIPQRTADPDTAVVPEVAPDFSDDHGYSIGGKFYIQAGIEIIDGFDQTNAANLKQIIHIFIGSGKAPDDTENQTEIPADVSFPGCQIPVFDAYKEIFFLRFF